MSTAYDFYRPLAHGEFLQFFREFFHSPHPYAPLFHLITAGIFLLLGVSRLAGVAANFLALAVLMISVNSIGNRLYGRGQPRTNNFLLQQPGLIAALLAVCYHFPAWLLHDAFLDYVLMAVVALAYALMFRADEFHVRSDAVLFGVTAGLGMMTKQTFAFFFILPVVYLTIRVLLRRDWRAAVNLFLSGAVAVLIASIWYVPHMDDVIGIYRVNDLAALEQHKPPVFSLISLAYYWVVLADLQIQLPFFALFVAGVVFSLRRRLRQDWMLYLWILSGVLSFTLLANKNMRYTVPILPAVALLSVSWLEALRLRFRSIAGVLIIVWAVVSFFNAQWPSERREIQLRVLRSPLYFFAGNIYQFDHEPLSEDWSIPDVVRASSGRLGVVPNIWQLNPSNVALYARLLAAERGGPPLVDVDWLVDDAALNRLDQCDYVLARTHLENAERVAPIELRIDAYLRVHSERFNPAQVFTLPLSQRAVLYKRR